MSKGSGRGRHLNNGRWSHSYKGVLYFWLGDRSFSSNRFSTDRCCKTLGDVLLHPNAQRQDALSRIEGISSIGQLGQAGSSVGKFLCSRAKMNSVSRNVSVIQPDRGQRVCSQARQERADTLAMDKS